MKHSHARYVALILLVVLVAGCAAGRAFRRGERAARAGDWDAAVEHFRRAVQEEPDRADFQIALERAMISASLQHLDQARVFEARGQLDDALREYRRASEYDPPNRQITAKIAELERRIRDQIEAARPRPTVQALRDAARQTGPPPLMNLDTVVQPLRFNQASLRDILNAIGQATGINVTYESTFQDRTYSVQLEGVTLAEALDQILSANQLFYKVINPRTIMVIPDNPTKRAQFEDLVMQTFYINHADPQELAVLINQIVRVGGQQIPPQVAASKTTNTITVRASASVAAIIEKLIQQNDKPRAEVVIDVQILEVSRSRAKQFGIDLSEYAIRAAFSPEASAVSTPAGDNGASSPQLVPQPFNANTITRGISTADFYLAVPAAIVRFLESDSETRVIAKPQLRGAEGRELILNLGEEIPVPSTTFTPVAQGGANFNPLTSFEYRPVGVNVTMTPRVTYDGDILLDLLVENSALGRDINIAGQNLPSFASRRVNTRLRLREGESTLLAGLLREDERRSLTGIPGLLRLPIIRQLFASNDQSIQQTDIVMLLTPRIVRTHELSPQDLAPVYIGTQSNLGLGGPPPLIAPPGTEPAAAPAEPVAPPPGGAAGVAAPTPGQLPGAVAVPAASAPSRDAAAGAAVAAGVGPGSVEGGRAPAVGGQVVLSLPNTEFRVGSGPYTVPISITGASQLSSVSLTVTYNPAVLRLRTIQEGSFMRAGGVAAVFTQQSDPATGRVDIAIVRPADVTGVAGTGLLAALLFDAVAPGPANLAVTGTATGPGGAPVALQFAPAPALGVK